jgi:hypothetical protein
MGKMPKIQKESNLLEPLKAKKIRESIQMDLWVLWQALMLLKIKISSSLTMKIQQKIKNSELKGKHQPGMEQDKHPHSKQNRKLQARIKDRFNPLLEMFRVKK